MKKYIILSLLFIVFSACSSLNEATPSESVSTQQPNTVQITDFKFIPNTLTVKAGDTVTWLHDDKVTHKVVFEDFESNNLERNDIFTHTFDIVGTYEYYCSIHPSMRGEIVVE